MILFFSAEVVVARSCETDFDCPKGEMCSPLKECASGVGACERDTQCGTGSCINKNSAGVGTCSSFNSSKPKESLYGAKTTAESSGFKIDDNHTVIPMVNNIVSVALSIAARLFFAMALYGGVRWITARGQEDLVKRGREAIEAAVFGLIIVVASYAIATFVVGKLFGSAAPGAPNSDSCLALTDGSGCCTGISTGYGASAINYCKAVNSSGECTQGSFVNKSCQCIAGCQ